MVNCHWFAKWNDYKTSTTQSDRQVSQPQTLPLTSPNNSPTQQSASKLPLRVSMLPLRMPMLPKCVSTCKSVHLQYNSNIGPGHNKCPKALSVPSASPKCTDQSTSTPASTGSARDVSATTRRYPYAYAVSLSCLPQELHAGLHTSPMAHQVSQTVPNHQEGCDPKEGQGWTHLEGQPVVQGG